VSTVQAILSTSADIDVWHRGDAYERYMGRWSRRVAPRYLRWMNIAGGRRWLDVGCGTGAFSAALVEAGFRSVTVSAIDIELHFADFDDYWQPFLAGQGPAPAHAVRLTSAQRERVRELQSGRLPVRADGTILLHARAWAARGIRR
jgi:SAM-dependent methyltransferase